MDMNARNQYLKVLQGKYFMAKSRKEKSSILKARINSIGKARENSIVRIVKKDMNKIKKMLKFFLEIIIKEELLDDRISYVYNNTNTMGKV